MATLQNLVTDRTVDTEVVARLTKRLSGEAAEAEAARQLTDQVVAEAEPLYAMAVPTSLGGGGARLPEVGDVTRSLAHGCPASAWTLSFYVLHAWLIAKFPSATVDEVFAGRSWALAPAPLAPTGTLVPTDGGYELTGKWEWATGVAHGDWVMVHAVVEGPEFATRFALVPVSDVEVEDVWHTSGMCATGSNTVRINARHVPAARTLDASELMLAPRAIDGDGMSGLAVPPVLATVASGVALGAAEAAVAAYQERITERVLAYTVGDKAKDQPAAQSRLAAAIAELAGIRTRWDRTLLAIDGTVGTRPLTDGERTNARLIAAATVRDARQLIGVVGEGSGASVYFSASPLQRFQRDVEVLKGHVIFDWDRTTELAGRVALGQPLRPGDMA